jgi:hypothetical protein
VLASTPVAHAADQAPPQPPDRLEKTPQPDPPKLPAETKSVEKSRTPANPDEDPAKLRERIAQDMQSAEKKLQANDPGRETRQVQDRILSNIDKLIELARNPPPPPPPSPMDNNPPMGGQPQDGLSRRERREQQRRQLEQQARVGPQRPMPGGAGQSQTTPGERQATTGQPGRDGMPDKLADVVKDIWGHLPETLRQEVDHYYRDQFMPRYRDLLQQYYSRLAERERKRGGDR